MAEPQSWNSAYQAVPPWDIGRPQRPFLTLAAAGRLRGRFLDAGCGTGEHTLLAAAHGADALGVDIAELAIDRARAKAAERGIDATFQVADVLGLESLGREFDVVVDSGVFHVFDDDERLAYVSSLTAALRPGGMYYMMCFSDREPGTWGPRRISEAELRTAFADNWSIRSLEAATFEVTIDPGRTHAWLATIERT